jgi:hypothetical protein
MILDDATVADDMRGWKADEVLTLLSHWGADAAFSVGEEEAPGGVFVLASQRAWDALHVLVRVGDRVTRFDQRLASPTQRDVDELSRVTAMVWAGPASGGEAGAQRYTLNVVSTSVRPAAYVDVRADGAATFTWADDRPAIDFTPAVRVRLGP